MNKTKILWLGDGVVPTGFSTVNHNIIKGLPEEEFEVHHLAVNYFGDPHEFKHYVYPATTPQTFAYGDVYGLLRLEEMKKLSPDIIFILNDIWVIDNYLAKIKDVFAENLPKIVVYFPVDGAGYYKGWFRNFDIVSKAVVYTEFGKRVVLKAVPELEPIIEVIPHGTNLKDFYYKEDRIQARKDVFHSQPELWTEDSFVVLNANRNQPRKRLDLSLLGFALFAVGKPKDVRYYHHAGLQDAGWNLMRLLERIDFELGHLYNEGDTRLQDRVILTNMENSIQRVPISKLNDIYNACDVGVNTSLGEGWGLVSTEHAVTGAVQVVPEHTACIELFEDCGLLTPLEMTIKDTETLLDRGFVNVENLAQNLELLYQDKKLRKTLADTGREKFSSEQYQWKEIAKIWKELFINLEINTKGETKDV